MSWLRLDDGFASHPKLAGLSDRQHRVWIRTLCYCAKYRSPALTDDLLKEIPGFDGGIDGALMRCFLKARLVDYVDGTYAIHDWEHYQPKDSTGAERQARYRNRHNGAVTDGVTENVTTPSRPVLSNTPPTPPHEGGSSLTRRDLKQYTGCRYVYNGRAPAYVHDPLGTDLPPNGWPHERPTKDEILKALA